MRTFWESVKTVVHLKTGIGRRYAVLSPEKEAVAAVFLPLVGLIAGFLAGLSSALVASLLQRTGSLVLVLMPAVAVLMALGGYKQLCSASRLFQDENRTVGVAVVSTLVLLFEILILSELCNRGYDVFCKAVIYLPASGGLATVAAASAIRSDDAGKRLSGVGWGHMLLSALLTFLLMLPAFGMRALVFVAASVLAGSFTALAARKSAHKEEAAYTAAILSELLFLITMLFLERSIIYY